MYLRWTTRPSIKTHKRTTIRHKLRQIRPEESITDDHSNAESDSEQDSVNKPIPKTNRNQKKKLKQTTKTNLADRKPRTITLVKRKYLLK